MKQSQDYNSVYSTNMTSTMTEMNISYLFTMMREEETIIKMVSVGAMLVEKLDGINVAIVQLLNPQILGEVPEGIDMTNIEPLEERWKLED